MPQVTEYKDKAGKWRHRMKADNNKIIDASSEGYNNLRDAIDNRIMTSIAYLEYYRLKLSKEDIARIAALNDINTRQELFNLCDFMEQNGRTIDYSLIDEYLKEK